MHAATRHCYYQRATLQLLLRQLRFCAAELAGIRQKQLQIADIGVQYFNRCLRPESRPAFLSHGSC